MSEDITGVNDTPWTTPRPVQSTDLLWVRTANTIRDMISDGQLHAGSRLLPERLLCEQLGVSRVTLRNAIAHLVDQRILGRGAGRGWYVVARQPHDFSSRLESFAESAHRRGLRPSSRVITAEVVEADFDLADAFSLPAGAQLFRLERVRSLNDVEVAYEESWVPFDVVPGITQRDFNSESLFTVLSEAGHEPLRARSVLEARKATADASQYLGLAIGEPVLAVSERTSDREERTILVTKILYRGDRFRLHTVFARGTTE